MPTSFFRLGAYVENDAADDLPTFHTPFDPARQQHDRLDMHFGTESALLVQLTDALGPIPAGATLEDALRHLVGLVIDAESILRQLFSLDAYVAEDVFWTDLFSRVLADILGTTSGAGTRFGTTGWQTVDSADLGISVDGAEAVFEPLAADSFADFVGYPTITSGEIYFELFMPSMDSTSTIEWGFVLFPFRDDVEQAPISVRLFRSPIITPSRRLQIDIGDDTFSAGFNVGEIWLAFRIQFAPVGGDVKIRVWRRDTETEPATWNSEFTHVAGPTFLVQHPVLEIYSTDNDPGAEPGFRVDNIKLRKTDTDPARIYHVARLDAWVLVPQFTLDAYIRPMRTLTLDAQVVSAFEDAFTLNAYVAGTGETGLLGDHILGTHELGGE